MRVVKLALAVLLWIVVALCLAATVLPHFLDRIYYEGPQSAHFDGAHFFNPDGDDDRLRTSRSSSRFGFVARYLLGDNGRPVWPDRVPVRPSKPAARVVGETMRVTWVGHATLLVQTNSLNILTDPVWSDRAGPLGLGPRRVAAPGVEFDDLPRIDLVLVSHNHYDHMDLTTLKRLWQRDRPLIVTSLGNDRVIGGAGVPARALDWGQSLEARQGVRVAVTRNHHWGSRWFSDRNRALWSSFVVELSGGNFFFSGDTGLGDGKWPAEAAALGPIRLAAIPIGAFRFQERQMAAGSHVGPLGALHIWQGLGQPQAIPIHWGTFRLSREAYDTPPRLLRAMQECAGADPRRFASTPIGQPVDVPPLAAGGTPPDFAKLDACIRAGRFDALR
ncbi:MBL fold metallo-hydrolase [Sphingomonas xinjiangensis]|uniref:L-ascorbate metabolism protein UlaG (Beta-lactamase superfamily) n=1 Tax=Sphingomonas xinjiangensis TaxID=643568 RepID=A0A840YHA7_9SPHN|nr:MBL fold metallo-hydrolase [Sphingomonas xinjiangensis]MBB5711725.1 L-ascorbate metabolism protein UlaG (beta-lactamase superfamily) [Sphingomonas xinjiangensis]